MEGPECPAAPQLPSVPLPGESAADAIHESPSKRLKLDHGDSSNAEPSPRLKGVAPIKPEYLVSQSGSRRAVASSQVDDDAAEGANDRLSQGAQGTQGKKDKKNKKQKGQNTGRDFGFSRDALQLCASRALQPEFSPLECKFGDSCKFEHDLRKYLSQGKREDLTTFKGVCPVWNARGICPVGWKCRFVGSHSEERLVDGRNELVLIEDPVRRSEAERKGTIDGEVGVVNVVTAEQKANLSRRRMGTPKSDVYLEWESKYYKDTQAASKEHGTNMEQHDNTEGEKRPQAQQETANTVEAGEKEICEANTAREDNRAQYRESPMLPSEKRRLYYGPETPVLAPLTTQGNLPFRRLCVELGAQVTWSEMALGLPLIQGHKPEWALMKAHESEITPPRVQGKGEIVNGYDNSKDLKFGAQIASNKPWLAVKTAEILTTLCPRLRAIDLNCGCPIELVYRQGAGSALLDAPGKLEKILRGMNVVSGEVPITVKIRMGTRDNQPTAEKLIKRLILGGQEAPSPSGVAAITLHGRSRQQRYTRDADWEYISNCAALIQRLKQSENEAMDTALEPDARYKPNNGKVYFVGNGDCYSHADYYSHIQEAKVDTVMVARGALIKPWIFEEIEKGQYLDKSASERLEYIERFVKFGLEAWGSDEMGVGTTRRFLLEWLSFSCRYVPIGLLEYLPPRIQDRPPAYKGRNELETLLSSDNYKDWIKISEMFLGPAHPNFRFEPKHKSNSYEVEAEG